jgi:Ser/Thr protein kinase RdoA (MazF antagonist)
VHTTATSNKGMHLPAKQQQSPFIMNHSDIARAFGFELPREDRLESIYPYAPVYRLRNPRSEWILKRTQKPLARAHAVAAWTQTLAAHGVAIVNAAGGFGENPRAFVTEGNSDEVWVVYPFITGNSYTGKLSQIRAAGELLGSIHSASPYADYGLKQTETVVAVEAVEIEQDIAGILEHVHAFYPEVAAAAKTTLVERARRYFQRALPPLLEMRLPLANCSWDYKASNIIFPTSTAPVLVDVDNAGRIPRAYDLAIAALLFHNEGMGPGRLFTREEWTVFLDSYFQHVQFSEEEKRVWDDLLLCAWMDEALWLLRDHESGWADPKQAPMLLSLLLTDLSTLALSL